jgi:DNA (cytosine-5)-methyltransferase 1
MLTTAKIAGIKEHRGNPRLWMEGHAPRRAGFLPGLKFVVMPYRNGVLLKIDETGDRTVSKKETASGALSPIIDINSSVDLEPLKGLESVRVVFGEGQVLVTPIASEVRRQRRLARLKERLTSGEPLQTAGIAAGGGVLSHAVHTGLADAGIASSLAAHNEIREDLTDHASVHNDAFSERTQMLNMPLQELAFDEEVLRRVGEVDIVELGLPCSGASVAGRAKRSLAMPEEHPDVGHLVVGALALLAKLNPSVCIFENVVPYKNSCSAVLIRQQLRDMGYICHEREVFGPDFGELEARTRWTLVAVTKGIDFDVMAMEMPQFAPRTLGEVLEPPEAVAERWSQMPGLKAKEIRDKEAGKGFMMQIFDGSESQIKTLTKGITKNRSTDPKIKHPTQEGLLRIPTAAEHARCKGVPETLIKGLAQTTAHELLGQGIVYGPFRHLAKHVGKALKAWATATPTVLANTMLFKAAA